MSGKILVDLLALSGCGHPTTWAFDVAVLEEIYKLVDQKRIIIANKQYNRYYERIKELVGGEAGGREASIILRNLTGLLSSADVERCKGDVVVEEYLERGSHYEEYSEVLCLLRKLLINCSIEGAIICVDRTLSWDNLERFLRNEVERELGGGWRVECSRLLVEYDSTKTKVVYVEKERGSCSGSRSI